MGRTNQNTAHWIRRFWPLSVLLCILLCILAVPGLLLWLFFFRDNPYTSTLNDPAGYGAESGNHRFWARC